MARQRARQSDQSIVAEVRGDNGADISAVYDAPFPIFSEEEGLRYSVLRNKTIEVPIYFKFDVLEQIGLKEKLLRFCEKGQWEQFVGISYPVYRELTLEFFTSLRYLSTKPKKFWFRLRGQVYVLDETVLGQLFGFATKEVEDGHQNFCCSVYWKYLTDMEEYDPHVASNSHILHPEWLLVHKFMCGAVFGKKQSTKCSGKDLFLLWCIDERIKPNMFRLFSQTLIQLVGRKANSLGMGYLATALAQHFHIDVSQLVVLDSQYFDEQYLKHSEILERNSMQLRDPRTRKTVKHRFASAGSSSTLGPTCDFSSSEDEDQQQPQQRQQAGWTGVVNVMGDHHKQTLQMLTLIDHKLNRLNQRMDNIDDTVAYMSDKMHRAWEMQGLNVRDHNPLPPGSQQGS